MTRTYCNLSGNPSDLIIGEVGKYKTRPYYSRESTTKFLSDTISRVQTEVGEYIRFLAGYNGCHPSQEIGFFSLPRLLFPEIEAIQQSLYPGQKTLLLKELGVEYPAIVIQLFRNSLTHQTIPNSLIIGLTKIDWELGLNGKDHWIKPMDQLNRKIINPSGRKFTNYYICHIDLISLYRSLLVFCENLNKGPSLKQYIRVPFACKVPKKIKGKPNKKHIEVIKEVESLNKQASASI